MVGWFTDGFRTAWGLLYWNVRKTLFRWRKPAFSPCQNPSDSGRGGETRCDACFGWRDPKRFRRVCPLLQPSLDGTWLCSVDTAEVRPFWLRAFAWYGGVSLATYLTLVLVGFGVLRGIGYPVRLESIAWPPAWSEIQQARSKYFQQRAEEAYARQEINEALLSLRLAYDYDPGNYDAGLMLARLWQTSRPDLANRMYSRLLQEHPTHRSTTAQLWLRALLPRADYAAIEELAAAALHFDGEHAGAWLHALLFATERSGNRSLLDRLRTEAQTLPSGVAHVLETEAQLAGTDHKAGLRRLLQPRAPDQPDYVAYHQIRRLTSLGLAQPALDFALLETRRLPDYDRISLELEALATLNNRRLRFVAFENLAAHSDRLKVIELIAAHLIRFPDPDLYERWLRRVDLAKLPNEAERLTARLTLLCVAGAQLDEPRLREWAEALRETTGASYAALDAARAYFLAPAGKRLSEVLPFLQPLSLEVNYALLSRFGPPLGESPRS